MIDYKGVDFSKILKRYDVEAQNETTPEAVAKKMRPSLRRCCPRTPS